MNPYIYAYTDAEIIGALERLVAMPFNKTAKPSTQFALLDEMEDIFTILESVLEDITNDITVNGRVSEEDSGRYNRFGDDVDNGEYLAVADAMRKVFSSVIRPYVKGQLKIDMSKYDNHYALGLELDRVVYGRTAFFGLNSTSTDEYRKFRADLHSSLMFIQILADRVLKQMTKGKKS